MNRYILLPSLLFQSALVFGADAAIFQVFDTRAAAALDPALDPCNQGIDHKRYSRHCIVLMDDKHLRIFLRFLKPIQHFKGQESFLTISLVFSPVD